VNATARLLDLGRMPYRDALALQRTLHAGVARGEMPDTWLLVEHDPVVTLGRNAKLTNLHAAPEWLAARGVDIVSVERGGDATYHGPGQLVVYPICKLPRFREIVPFVSKLERAVVRSLAAFGIEAAGRPEHRGVYVGREAICAVGLAVKQMTSMHGLALNVSTQLDYDRLIVPCGTPEFGITSISRHVERTVTLEEARGTLVPELAAVFETSFHAMLAAAVDLMEMAS